jgi:uncharacterized membrane protein
MKDKTIVGLIWGWVIFLALATTLFAILRTAFIIESLTSEITVNPNSIDYGYKQHPVLSFLHILPGMIFMIFGPLQFVERIRTKHIKLHRWSGRLFVVSSFITGASAILIGFIFPFGGPNETAATFVFGVIFLFSLCKAFYHIKRFEVAVHREWMLRTFSIGLGVSTIRLLIPFFQIFTELSFKEFFGIAFWIAFVLHLVFAEFWINYTRA